MRDEDFFYEGAERGDLLDALNGHAHEGATVVLAGRSRDKGEALADELGERALFKRTDIMSEDDIAALVDFTVERFGRLDCLFNNAGAGDRTTVDSFEAVW